MSKAPPEEKATTTPPQPAPAAKEPSPAVNKGKTMFTVLNLEWPGEDGGEPITESQHCFVGDSVDVKRGNQVIVTITVARLGSVDAELSNGPITLTAREPAKATS